jgi:hypothetical protein
MKKLASVTLSLNRFGASSRLFLVFLASACSSYMVAVNAHAVEDITPFLPGATIGVPVGALPPPGLYFSSANTVFDMNVKNDQGQNTGIHVLDPSMKCFFTCRTFQRFSEQPTERSSSKA